MAWKTHGFAAALAALLAAGPAGAGCAPGDRIDGSTADDAKRQMEAAGYEQIADLKKGCDNYWHGRALKDGAPVGVVLSPQGEVMTEGE